MTSFELQMQDRMNELARYRNADVAERHARRLRQVRRAERQEHRARTRLAVARLRAA